MHKLVPRLGAQALLQCCLLKVEHSVEHSIGQQAGEYSPFAVHRDAGLYVFEDSALLRELGGMAL